MRIRTIKPEFWTHPDMTRLPHDTRLLAIALLNYADDEGYFYADPDLVRGSIMFREDSTNVRRMIDELSRQGWIELSGTASKPVGRVVNFTKHQRIDRPQPSRIRHYWLADNSSNDRRALDELSLLEQGTGNRDQGSGNGKETTRAVALEFPEHLRTAEFMAEWEKWVEYRKGLKTKRPKDWNVMFQSQLVFLGKFSEPQAVECIEASIRGGWQGLFEPKNGTPASPQHRELRLEPNPNPIKAKIINITPAT